MDRTETIPIKSKGKTAVWHSIERPILSATYSSERLVQHVANFTDHWPSLDQFATPQRGRAHVEALKIHSDQTIYLKFIETYKLPTISFGIGTSDAILMKTPHSLQHRLHSVCRLLTCLKSLFLVRPDNLIDGVY